MRLLTVDLVIGYDDDEEKLLWQLALLPAADQTIAKFDMEHRKDILSDFWCGAVNICCLATLKKGYGFNRSFVGMGLSNSCLSGN